MEGWRETLAKNLAIRNPGLENVRQLNYAVQMTIDRIVFLRICEDRGIEEEGKLKSLLSEPGIYARLCDLFRIADKRYNSGLFHFSDEKGQSSHPDDLTPCLKIDDKVLKEIVSDLYYPSPYVFKLIPADILGQVYERFLGKVIRLTAGHQARVEEKPEVRKAGGVYYTPTFIVDYIVRNTVGKLLEGKTPAEAEALKIVDPACGSGSFLLGAFQYLIDWHNKYYRDHDPEKWAKGGSPAIYRGQGGDWQLSTHEKKRILLNNLHGVDIDPQAVEVTKLSLLLKVLEEESGQLSLGFERALPDLGRNIQCGNSLIGPDYYDAQQLSMDFMDEEERQRVNAFDWRSAFPQVFAKGGFDVVIGNPPYVRQESLGSQKEYFQKHFQTYQGTADLYTYFIEKGVRLLRPGGLFSYIVANKWMRTNYGKPLRSWMKEQCIEEIIDFGDLPVFEQATTYPCILRIRAGKKPLPTFNSIKVGSLDFNDLGTYVNQNSTKVDPSKLDDEGWSLSGGESSELQDKLKQRGIPLGEFVNRKIFYGIKTGLNEAFVIDSETRNRLIENDPKNEEIIVPFLAGRDIKRYALPKSDRYLILIPKGWTRKKSGGVREAWDWFVENYPAIADHLQPYEQAAKKRFDKGEYWWELRSCDYLTEFNKPKLILPDISLRGNFMFDEKGEYYCVNTAYIIPVSDKYLLGVLNSKLITFIYSQSSSTYRGGYLRFIYQYLEKLPIHRIDDCNKDEFARYKKLEELVGRMLGLMKKYSRTPQEKESLQREVKATDNQIDQLVYELYGLTEEEIKVIEGEIL